MSRVVDAFAIGRADSHPSWLDGHDGASREFLSVPRQCRDGRLALVFGAKIHEAHDTNVRSPFHDGQLAEIFVEGDQNLSLTECMRQQLIVAWIAPPISCRLDIVSDGGERLARPTPDTTVEKNLHTLTFGQRGFNALVPDQPSRIHEAGPNVVGLEPGVALEDGLGCIPGGQHAEDMLDGETVPANDRLAAEDRGIRRDASEQDVLIQQPVLAHGGTKS